MHIILYAEAFTGVEISFLKFDTSIFWSAMSSEFILLDVLGVKGPRLSQAWEILHTLTPSLLEVYNKHKQSKGSEKFCKEKKNLTMFNQPIPGTFAQTLFSL